MRTYSSSIELNADIVQALYVTHGRRASKQTYHPTHHGVQFAVSRNGFSTRDSAEQGRRGVAVGCVTTHNGTVLIRQNGRVAVVGNCPGDLRKAQRPAILTIAQPGGTHDMLVSRDPKDGSFIAVDPSGAVDTFAPNGRTPGGHYLGGLNTHPDWHAGQGQAEGPPVAVNHYDDGNPAFCAYVIVTQDPAGGFHNYNFPSNGSSKGS